MSKLTKKDKIEIYERNNLKKSTSDRNIISQMCF